MSEGKNVVCVFAHQDDEMRCLGTLLRLRQAGHRIGFVCVTRGDKGLAYDPNVDFDTAAGVRDAEMRAVADAFDAEYRCLGREDGFLYEDAALRHDLIDVLCQFRADLVFTHWTEDYNSDHVVTARAVTDAALFTSIPSFVRNGTELVSPPRIFYVHPGDGYGFEATHFVPLGPAHQRRKTELIRLHRSQMDVMRTMRGRDYADEMADEDRRQGARMLVSAAETFRPCLAERRVPVSTDLPGELEPDEDQ
ncbi:PIG-L deacetylase family protein [Actinocrispum wychmicini]|uniref:LmbE family N-acetylglucosaminyl deacetylase n=1 Tax=Actinocrispum wychmicini TaxID=1213861 RepID=A0A4R2JG63_9PSEU|nr:PIG-L family deacetylase [Actinocrispum wychmicini]TCO55858.1 LmbE family N-acetylglucosaminyl deacetylase [Actinocrispum wychmicini]